MKPWLIFGAGGSGVGAGVLELALAEGRSVVALVRKPDAAQRLREQGVTVIEGDASDPHAVEQACQAAGEFAAIISTLGGAQDYLAHRVIIDTAEKCGLSQMVMVTSLGCGDSWPTLSQRARAAFGQAVREKSLAEIWLQTSSLDFAIVRPGGLLNGTATCLAQLYQHQKVHGFVYRSDVAKVVQQLLAGTSLNNQTYSLVQPELTPATNK
ncbi:MAG: NAD(P)H-binding protein [Limnobaculum xujianqingii]